MSEMDLFWHLRGSLKNETIQVRNVSNLHSSHRKILINYQRNMQEIPIICVCIKLSHQSSRNNMNRVIYSMTGELDY